MASRVQIWGAIAFMTGCGEPGDEPFAGCRDDPLAPPTAPLAPRETDAAISGDVEHYTAEASGDRRDALFLMLPGTGGPPVGYRMLLSVASASGYDALALAYRNEVAVNDLCSVTEPGCHAAVRSEIITGEDATPLIDVRRVDSIEHRLVAALSHLGWDRYLVGDAPDWSKIAVAGHSQGAGHAGFLARGHAVERALLFAGTEPADWTEEPLSTAPSRLFGFIHVDDSIYAPVIRSWDNLGIPQAQRFETRIGDDPHGAVATDPHVPEANVATWCSMLD